MPAPKMQINHSGFNEARYDGIAMASAGPYENHLHFNAHRYQCQHLITYFLKARCSS